MESVAWVAERKDSLSAAFGFLALWSYVRYVERPSVRRYLLVALALVLGLMSKPMLVTLPLVMLLLDVWPFERVAGFSWVRLAVLVREKLPLFGLAAAAALATYLVQRAGGAVRSTEAFPLVLRVENALVTYVIYIAEMFWPTRLAVFYPYPAAVPAWEAAGAALLLVGISILALRSARRRPYLAVGWFWYAITLAPVIGLVQVGAQAHADRYTYLPMVGLTIMLAWGALDVVRSLPRTRPAMVALGAATCAACAALTWVQAGYWRDSRTLFQHAVDVTEGNYLAHHNLGVALAETPDGLERAIAEYREALAIKPNSARALTDLGSALARLPGRLPEATAEFRAALAIDPNLAIPHNNLGSALLQAGQWSQAITEYEAALRIEPDYAEALHGLAEAECNLGLAMAKTGKPAEAIRHLEAALQLRPGYVEAHNNLGVVLAQTPGRGGDAMAHFEAAVQLDPSYADAHVNLGVALSQLPGRMAEAIAQLEAAQRIQPDAEVQRMIERMRAGGTKPDRASPTRDRSEFLRMLQASANVLSMKAGS